MNSLFDEKDELFQLLYDHIPSGAAVYRVINDGAFGSDYIIKRFNREALRIEQKTLGEVVGKSLKDLRPSIDDFGLIPVFREVWKSGQAKKFETRLYHDNRFHAWYENTVFKLPSGEIVAIYNDVTEKMQAQQALEEAYREKQIYIEKAPYGIFVADKHGDYVEVNQAACDMTGYSRNELLSMNLRDLSSDAERADGQFNDAKHRTYGTYHAQYTSKHGEIRDWSVKTVALSEELLIGFTEDLTEHNRLDCALAESLSRYKALFHSSGNGIGYFSKEGTVISFNQKAAENMGGRPEDFVGKSFYELFDEPEADKYMQRLNAATASRQPQTYEDCVQLPAKTIWFLSTYTCLCDESQNVFGVQIISQDITAIKTFQLQITQHKELIEKANQVAQIGCWYHSKALNDYYWSEGMFHVFDMACQEKPPTVQALLSRIHPLDRKDFKKQLVNSRKKGMGYDFIFRITCGEGVKWLRTVGEVSLDENEGSSGAMGIVQDITASIEEEERLIERERRFHNLFERAPLGYQSLSMEGYFLDVNAAWLELFGYCKEEVIGKAFGDFVAAEHMSRFKHCFEHFKQNGEITTELAMRSKHRGARLILFEGRIAKNPATGQRQTHCILKDITESKEQAERLNQVLASLKRAEQIARIGYSKRNWKTGEVVWSEGFCNILGVPHSRDNQSHEDFLKCIHPNDQERYRSAFEDALRHAKPIDIEYRIVRQDGTIAHIHGLAEHTFDESGRLMTTEGIIYDITDQKRLEQEHLELEAQMRQQQKLESIGLLAGGVAHEINNPINGIMNYSQLIIDDNTSGGPAVSYAKKIIDETNRVSNIVKNLLQFSRQEKQTHSYAQVEDIVESTLSLIRTIIRHDQISLKVDIEQALPQLKCRSQQIQQVLLNLLTNARDAVNQKYTGYDADKLIEVSCRQILKKEQRWLRLCVEDHGVGILDEVKSKMFEPFFTTKSKEYGTGLGLSITYGIVKEHHGEINVDSEIGRGARFCVDLPFDNGWELV